MPETHVPKTPEQASESKPHPEQQLQKNEQSQSRFKKKMWEDFDRREQERYSDEQAAAQQVFDEWNRGEEAWHRALQARNALTESQRRWEAWKKADAAIDEVRGWRIDWQERENTPRDFAYATIISTEPKPEGPSTFLWITTPR